MRMIDADKLLLHLADYQLQEAPMWGANGYGSEDAYDAITECIRAVEEMSTIEERKKGEWKIAYLDHEAFGVRPMMYYCSECHHITTFRTFFCPNCGADMRGEDDG